MSEGWRAKAERGEEKVEEFRLGAKMCKMSQNSKMQKMSKMLRKSKNAC